MGLFDHVSRVPDACPVFLGPEARYQRCERLLQARQHLALCLIVELENLKLAGPLGARNELMKRDGLVLAEPELDLALSVILCSSMHVGKYRSSERCPPAPQRRPLPTRKTCGGRDRMPIGARIS